MYQARVLGEFPDQGEDTLIALSMIEGAVGRFDKGQGSPPSSPDCMEPEGMANSPSPPPVEEDFQGPVVIAVDVARFGSDKSVILRRCGMLVEEIKAYRGLDTMKLVGLVVDAIRVWEPEEVVVDEVGIGAGVVDRLREQGYSVHAVNVGMP